MIVVADTSPLNYLIQIQCDHLLPGLYRTVIVPLGVIEELRSPKAPLAVKDWTVRLPGWLEIHPLTSLPNPELTILDAASVRRFNWPKSSVQRCC